MVGFCCIPVDRDNPRPSTIKEAVRRLRDGELIVIFPEGGIPDGERFGEVKRGIGVIAAMSQAPVVPALIMGTERALPVGAKIPRFKRIDVFFEKPINKKKHESAEDFDRRVCSEIIGHIKSVKIAGD
jgi:1-acyl-sn-glycerol-3-phosphate acyltransferase